MAIKRPALLLVDFFSLFDFPGGQALAPRALAAARHASRLRTYFDAQDWPVIYANDNFSNWRSDFRQQVTLCRRAKGIPGQIASLLSPGSQHYFILKPKHSAFLATPLPVLLSKLDVGRLVLAGMTADSCILATALDANAREFDVVLVKQTIAGMPSRKRDALDVLAQSKAAAVVSMGKDLEKLRPVLEGSR